MLKRNERMDKLNAAGVDTNKYFTLNIDSPIPAGSKIHIAIDKNGSAVLTSDDPIAEQIIEDGYVRNTKLHRRFIMAQMFRALNYKDYRSGKPLGYTEYVKRMYPYNYTIDMMLDEAKVLSVLEVKDAESFNERSHFFTRDVIVAVLRDYMDKLYGYIDGLPVKHCKGIPYKKIGSTNIFLADIDNKVYKPLQSKIDYISKTISYKGLYSMLLYFRRVMIKLPYHTPKSQVWMDAFKGEGAYYTCKNLIMYHNCTVHQDYIIYDRDRSMSILNEKLDEYQNSGWRMFAFMKKLIKDNNFDFAARMKEIYS